MLPLSDQGISTDLQCEELEEFTLQLQPNMA